jgi:uncharacterized protein YkwD
MRISGTRRLSLALAAAVTLLLLCVVAAPALAFDRAAAEATMLRLINHARTSRGLHAVSTHDALHKAARAHSVDMIRRDYFAHTSLSGRSVGARARKAGYKGDEWSQWSVGEVIAWGSGSRGTPAAVFKAWMKSRPHRKIVLGQRWRDVGVGCRRGSFKGIGGVNMWTVDVGRRVQ